MTNIYTWQEDARIVKSLPGVQKAIKKYNEGKTRKRSFRIKQGRRYILRHSKKGLLEGRAMHVSDERVEFRDYLDKLHIINIKDIKQLSAFS